jgi:CRISPR-associated protein Csx14
MIRVKVDPTNPGQFFACCGLLELADRLWPGAGGWFQEEEFRVTCGHELNELVPEICKASLKQLDPDDDTGSAIELGEPFRPLLLDWWHDELFGFRNRLNGKELKVWAGTMESVRIAKSMQLALRDERFLSPDLFNVGLVAYDPEDSDKKVEPYYFDARRGPNAHSRDVGFSPNDLGMTTMAFPAVEFLCLVGVQRARAEPTEQQRIYDYYTWPAPILTNLILPVSTGRLSVPGQRGYRFENWYRTSQKKHKAFLPAIPHKQ